MICQICREEADKVKMVKVPNRGYKQLCESCECELDDYYDRERGDND